MKLTHNLRELAPRRRELRRHQTQAEDVLWQELRNNKLGSKFRRQYSIGGYILDFYCANKRLIIEVDGEIHKKQKEYDRIRDKYFIELDYKVLRFKNTEIINNIESVIYKIKHA